MESIWSRDVKIEKRESFVGNQRVQAAVIGAGMPGILIAYYLQESGLDVVVLEADRIASGQTKNTTAKITSQHGLFYNKLMKNLGEEKAWIYAEANERAIRKFAKIIEKEKIDCHFKRLPSVLYSTKDSVLLEAEADAAMIAGITSRFTMESELPFPIKGAVVFENQAQFHPLEFIANIESKLTIYEKTRVLSVKDHMIYTERGNIWAENIVFATHYPIINVPGLYFLRQHQERSYVLALENAQNMSAMYYGIEQNELSFRMEENVLLMGGSGHRTGENQIKGAYEYLRNQANQYYPQSTEVAHWSAQDCVTHDGIPFIGKYSRVHPYWYVATGFKKWGMTSSMVSAMIIRSQILGEENSYVNVFSPQRFHWKLSHKYLLQDIGISVKGLTNGHLKRKVVECPHLGCEMKWNPDEETWDCPCHGSRYDKHGKLIDDPAQRDMHDDELNRIKKSQER